MDRENNRHKLFSRRAALLAGGKLGLIGLLGGRMYYLQVVEAEQYKLLAEENRISVRLLPPPRGRIFDRFGEDVAVNRQNFRLLLVPENAGDVEATLSRLGQIINIPPHQHRRILRDIKNQRSFVPVKVTENLSWQEFAEINVNLPDLPGIQPDVGETRHYPHGPTLSHVVGYVSSVSERELTGDPVLELPGFRIGKNGIEKIHDLDLRGQAGNSRVEVNAVGRVIRELARKEGERGHDAVLTIDVALQNMIHKRLGNESAAAVVLDVHSGEVLAMVSTPAYDPNAFSFGISSGEWRRLINNPRTPLINKATAGQYPPGSTFKMVVALAALEAGVVPPDHTTFCNGRMRLGRNTFHCWRWRYGGHGHVDLRQALEQSCDIYFYDIAKRVGVDRIAAMAERLGFGQKLGIELVGERPGLIPTKAWKLAVKGEPWQGGETLNVGIGQGQVLTTPLQMAVMTARLANGGRAVVPRLVRQVAAKDGAIERPLAAPLNLQPAALDLVLKGMGDVVNGSKGTARRAQLDGEVTWAGKTGSAQVRRISKKERATRVLKNEERPWEERDHGMFVGFAPQYAPQYAVAVTIEHYGSGAKTALVARDIMEAVLERNPSPQTAAGPTGAKRTEDKS